MDFGLVDPARLAVVDAIVTEVIRVTGTDPGAILLIGAEARDALHVAQGHTTALRGTTDVDMGIALSDWSVYEGVRQGFAPIGHTGIRFMIADMAVDVVPFGAVEDPRGLASPRGREDEAIIVFGFVEVMRRALVLPLPSGTAIRVPRVQGYAALKMRAWIDRSPQHEEKDAYDLAVALHWYLEDPAVQTRTWEEPALLIEAEGDVDVVIASLLGSDVAAALSAADGRDLLHRWLATDLDALARAFSFERGRPWTGEPARARLLLDALTRGVASGISA